MLKLNKCRCQQIYFITFEVENIFNIKCLDVVILFVICKKFEQAKHGNPRSQFSTYQSLFLIRLLFTMEYL